MLRLGSCHLQGQGLWVVVLVVAASGDLQLDKDAGRGTKDA